MVLNKGKTWLCVFTHLDVLLFTPEFSFFEENKLCYDPVLLPKISLFFSYFIGYFISRCCDEKCCCVPEEDVTEKTLNLHCSYRDRDSVIYDFEGKNSIKKEISIQI